ncbi:MAG TPA: methanogen output domain 1-containing protein [Micromonosporaceae bacterium]
MEWFLDPPSVDAARSLRVEIARYLRRHGASGDGLAAAELSVAELINNAVTHAGGPIWVTLDWSALRPVLTVHDLGPTFEPRPGLPDADSPHGRGLWLVAQLSDGMRVAAKRAGGKQVSTTLPVDRAPEPSYDPAPRRLNPLPSMTEAMPDGFGRETFLRAMVVELALAVEDQHGPQAAEAAVARVGATVGGQMEREYRLAKEIVGRMSPKQIADCYVRLKAAIGGEFYLIEVTPERIVLGNRRCPFGDVVRQSPALCRMTSSVFGGIAARNGDRATVALDERIALGDPECRVTVYLGGTAKVPAGHQYQTGALAG